MGVFANICREYSALTKIELKYQALFCEDLRTCMTTSVDGVAVFAFDSSQ
jgi:hypothetical protein